MTDHERMTESRLKWWQEQRRSGKLGNNFESLIRDFETERAEVERLRGLLRVAKCPACNGSGVIPDGQHGCYQCQWCDERQALLIKAAK